MQFSSYGEAAEALKEARYETLDRLIKIANDENCDLIVIAGDLFDRVSMKKADVIKAMSSINKFENGPVLILPGNHDFFRNDSNLWRSGNLKGIPPLKQEYLNYRLSKES